MRARQSLVNSIFGGKQIFCWVMFPLTFYLRSHPHIFPWTLTTQLGSVCRGFNFFLKVNASVSTPNSLKILKIYSTFPSKCWTTTLNKPKNISSHLLLIPLIVIIQGTRWCSWLRHCATSRKVKGLIPDGIIGIFHSNNPSCSTMAMGLTRSLTEMSTRNISWGVKAAGA